VTEWEQSRDFYVILEGTAEVVVGGESRKTLRAGDFFGELGALDWGAGYGLSRTATVRTAASTRLLVLPDGTLNRVIGELPLVESRIRAEAGRRLSERAGFGP
jgi:CRP-like cAMP-binding protein